MVDKPVRFFFNDPNISEPDRNRLMGEGKNWLKRLKSMQEAGSATEVWNKETNEGTVYKFDTSGEVDNVKIISGKAVKKKDLEEYEYIEELVPIIELTDGTELPVDVTYDGDIYTYYVDIPMKLRLYEDLLRPTAILDAVNPKIMLGPSDYRYPVTDKFSIYYHSIEKEDTEVYIDELNLVSLYDIRPYIVSTYEFEEIEDVNYYLLDRSVYHYDYWNDFGGNIHYNNWYFEGDGTIMGPASIPYNLESNEFETFYISLFDYAGDFLDVTLEAETWLLEKRYTENGVATREHVATGVYFMGVKYAYPEDLYIAKSRSKIGIDAEGSGSMVSSIPPWNPGGMENYPEYSTWMCLVLEDNFDFSDTGFEHSGAITSDGETAEVFDYDTLDFAPTYGNFSYYMAVRDNVDGYRKFHLFDIEEGAYAKKAAGMCLRIYDYHGIPIFAYCIYRRDNESFFYGYVHRNTNKMSQEFPKAGVQPDDGTAYSSEYMYHDFYESISKLGMYGIGNIRIGVKTTKIKRVKEDV